MEQAVLRGSCFPAVFILFILALVLSLSHPAPFTPSRRAGVAHSFPFKLFCIRGALTISQFVALASREGAGYPERKDKDN